MRLSFGAVPSEKRQRQRENSRARQEAAAAAAKQSQQRTRIIGGVVLAVVVVGALFLWGPLGGSDDGDTVAANDTTTTLADNKDATPTTSVDDAMGKTGDAKTCPPEGGTSERFTAFSEYPKMCIDEDKTYTATVKTDVGTYKVDLDAKTAPKAVNSFVFLARNRFFDGIIFHRVIPDFVIQGGDPMGTGSGGPGYKFEDEIPDGHKYAEGDLAMANSGPGTNGSQFFVVTSAKGADTLLSAVGGVPKYTPFGRVIEGMDVIKRIEADGDSTTPSGTTLKATHKMISVTITEE